MSRPLLLRLAALLLSVGMLGACSSGSGEEAGGSQVAPPAPAPTSTTTTAPPMVSAPLTGEQVTPEVAARTPVSVKVDNSPDGRPQAGLDRADIVFEEKVEGGVTRFIGVYHSNDSDLIGPIRSLRTTDAAIVSAVGGVFAFSDGVAISKQRLRSAPVTAVFEAEGPAPFKYPKGRRRPYATFGSTTRLRKEAADEQKPPPPFFSFLASGEQPGGTPATRTHIAFGGRTTATLEWDAASSTWLRSTNGSPHVLADGTRLAFDNVIIQFVPYRPAGYRDITGSVVDEADVVGAGEAIVLSGGTQRRARWSKASPTAVTEYTDEAGAPVKLSPGNTLVALPPRGAPVTVS